MTTSTLGKLGRSIAKVTLHNSDEGKTVFSIRENGVAFKTEKTDSYRLLRTLPLDVSFADKMKFANDFVSRVQHLNQYH